MSVNRYQQAQKVAESPRQVEYRLFAQITSEMIAARDAGHKGPELIDSLHRNRELWSVLSVDCGAKGNGLPNDLRANIISVGLWVNRHTTAVIAGDEKIDDLIEVNKTIMSGLSAMPIAA